LARQLFLTMRETQESLEGAARQLRALAVGLDLDSDLISQSEFAVVESFNAMGRLSPALTLWRHRPVARVTIDDRDGSRRRARQQACGVMTLIFSPPPSKCGYTWARRWKACEDRRHGG
jgi:hypothetical protein